MFRDCIQTSDKETNCGAAIRIKEIPEDDQYHIILQFSIREVKGALGDLLKTLDLSDVSITTVSGGASSNGFRELTLECKCSYQTRKILPYMLKNNGAVKAVIKEEIKLPPINDKTECAAIDFVIEDEVRSFYRFMESLSNTESFQNGKCEVCSIKMSTDAKGWQKICIVCVYPKGVMRVDLEREIGAKIKKDITMRPLRIGLKSGDYSALPIKLFQCDNFLQSTYFTEAKERMNVSFLYHHILECNCKGREYTSLEHDITIIIPEGALDENQKVNFEIGVALQGPFNFPENTQPISPILWLCLIEKDIKLKKPFRIILPHFLTGISEERMQYHKVGFVKASHITNNEFLTYNFYHCTSEPGFVSGGFRSYGILESQHCCFYCLQAKMTPELTGDSGYCLARIESLLSPQRNEVHFSVTYFLQTCLKSLEEQFPQTDGYRITHCDVRFQDGQEPYIKVVVPQDSDKCLIGMEPLQAMIKKDDINFWEKGEDHMRLRHEKKMYPPRVKMTVSMTDPHQAFKLPVRFEGCSSDSQVDLELTFPLTGFPSASYSASPKRPIAQGSLIKISEKPDLKTVFKQLLPISTEWKSIGLFLDLPPNSLKRIATEEQGINGCLQAMLDEWLKQVDPHPSWAQLIQAVELLNPTKAEELRSFNVVNVGQASS